MKKLIFIAALLFSSSAFASPTPAPPFKPGQHVIVNASGDLAIVTGSHGYRDRPAGHLRPGWTFNLFIVDYRIKILSVHEKDLTVVPRNK